MKRGHHIFKAPSQRPAGLPEAFCGISPVRCIHAHGDAELFPNLRFKKVVTIFTEVKGLPFADEAVRLGPDFMDAYEDPLIHRQNEQI